MIRLPLQVWASPMELQELHQLAKVDPLPDDWAELRSKIARRSTGFADWLRQVAQHKWIPDDKHLKEQLAKVDFAMPWCARLRWGAGDQQNVDVFIHATGNAGSLEWETV